MSTAANKSKYPISNYAYSASIFSTLGWALLQAWGLYSRASFGIHLFTAAIGLYLVFFTVRRYSLRQAWHAARKRRKYGAPKSKSTLLVAVGSCFLLLAMGSLFGRLVLAGWLFPLGIFCCCLTFFPWSRVPLYREHFFSTIVIVVLSAGAQLVMAKHFTDAFSVAIPVWVIWSYAVVALVCGGKSPKMPADPVPDKREPETGVVQREDAFGTAEI